MSSLQEVAAEALASAIYNMPFSRFLGEADDPAEKALIRPVVWFNLSRDPDHKVSARDDHKQVVVGIYQLEEGLIEVRVTWLNLSGGLTVLPGAQTFYLTTLTADEAMLRVSTEQIILRVLDIYTDVLEGTGVAGPIELVAPESFAGDEDDPDDMAVPE